MKSSKKRDIIALSIIILIVASIVTILLVLLLPKNNDNKPMQPTNEYVYLYIDCKTILGKENNLNPKPLENSHKNGIILDNFKVPYHEGMSVYDALIYAEKENLITVQARNDIYGIYIEGINHLYEKSYKNGLGGWMYAVNGEEIMNTMSNAKLEKNDIIEVKFTCEVGDIVWGEYERIF